MSIKLEFGASSLTLNDTFTLKGLDWSKRSKTMNIAWGAGGRDTGDKQIAIRTIKVEGIIYGTDTAAYLTAIGALYAFLDYENLKVSFQSDRYINARCITNIRHSFYDGAFNRIARVSFDLVCVDPFWYYVALTTDTKVIAATPTTWSISNAGSAPVFPIITITNSANNFSLELKNTTDNNRSFNFADAGFLNTEAIIIDNKEGTIRNAGVNVIDKMSGNFLRLLPGSNSLTYTGANCTIVTEFYKREI